MTVLPDTEFKSLDINLELAVIYFKPSMQESLEREGDDWKDLVLIFQSLFQSLRTYSRVKMNSINLLGCLQIFTSLNLNEHPFNMGIKNMHLRELLGFYINLDKSAQYTKKCQNAITVC